MSDNPTGVGGSVSPDVPVEGKPSGKIEARDLASAIMLILGVLDTSVGVGVLWGIGASVFALGITLIGLGVLVGYKPGTVK